MQAYMRKRTWGMVIGMMVISLWLAAPPAQATEIKRTASDGMADDNFGFSVSINGEAALIGTFGDNSTYVFVRDSATGAWSEQTKLTASDGATGDRHRHHSRCIRLVTIAKMKYKS